MGQNRYWRCWSVVECFIEYIFLQRLVERKGEKLFVGVDEYDMVIFDPDDNRYQVKTSFFAIMKQATSTVVDKYWITASAH
jgi:hypothetical protein